MPDPELKELERPMAPAKRVDTEEDQEKEPDVVVKEFIELE